MVQTVGKRVLILASHGSSLRNFRGALIERLCLEGIDVHVAAPSLGLSSSTSEWLRALGVNLHQVPIVRSGINPLRDIYSLCVLLVLIKRIKPHLYLGYTIKPVIWGGLASYILRVPQRISLITGLGYAFTGEATGKRKYIQLIVKRLYKWVLRSATLVFFQNPDDLREFQDLGLIALDKPVCVLNGSGVDLLKYQKVSTPNADVIHFLLIARLLGDKGVREYVLAASLLARKYDGIKFMLVGGLDPGPDGIPEKEINDWVSSGVIEWYGKLNDVRPAIAACHVFVLPSYREGTPRTVLEAMATGRPIITTNAPGCRETVVEDENGFLVPVRSVNHLVFAMERFINEPEIIPVMGDRSREIAEEKYDVHKVNAVMLREMGV